MTDTILLSLLVCIVLMYLNIRFITQPKMERKIRENEKLFSNKYLDDE